ncbi:hypothetical protein AU476_33010 [Cupriavidus sp. UYMSc13B]|nr:hypothetical protein AU476_33010 [Cupriavidus sp. UYMSc13B]
MTRAALLFNRRQLLPRQPVYNPLARSGTTNLDAFNRALSDAILHRMGRILTIHHAGNSYARDRHRLMLFTQIPDQSFSIAVYFHAP